MITRREHFRSIWVVEDGRYGDYRVVGVFTSRDNAKLIQKAVGGTIAEWPLDPAVKELRAGYTSWVVTMLRDGTVERCEAQEASAYLIKGEEPFAMPQNRFPPIWRRASSPAYKGKNMPDCLILTVWAKHSEHAIKIVNEIRTRMIAENKWEAP